MTNSARSLCRQPSLNVKIPLLLSLAALVAAGCQTRATATPAPPPEPTATTAAAAPTEPVFENQPIEGGPILLREDITLRKVIDAGGGSIKLVLNPADGQLYYLQPGNGIFSVDLTAGTKKRVASATVITGNAAGMAIGPDGTLYVVTNAKVGDNQTRATPMASGSSSMPARAPTTAR
jgi:hypothetical protein